MVVVDRNPCNCCDMSLSTTAISGNCFSFIWWDYPVNFIRGNAESPVLIIFGCPEGPTCGKPGMECRKFKNHQNSSSLSSMLLIMYFISAYTNRGGEGKETGRQAPISECIFHLSFYCSPGIELRSIEMNLLGTE